MNDHITVDCCEETETHQDILRQVEQSLPDEDTLYDLTELFRIFGDSTRVRILYAPVSYTHLDVYKRQPQDRVAQVGHVDPDLVGPAGLQPALHIGKAGEALQHLPVGHGAAPPRDHSHFLPIHWMAADRSVHSPRLLPEPANDDTAVGPGQGVVLELGRQALVGGVVLGRDDQS